MVYIAYDPNDGFWKNTAHVFFEGHKFLIDKITTIKRTNVKVYSTNIVDFRPWNVLYYVGHGGNLTGKPIALGSNVSSLIDFLMTHEINCINFLSCHTYNWLLKNCRVFARLLDSNTKIRLEGSREEINMIYIHSVINRSDFTSMEYIQLSKYTEETNQRSYDKNKNVLKNTGSNIIWGFKKNTQKTENTAFQTSTRFKDYQYVENVALDHSNNYIYVKAPYKVFRLNEIKI